jgi:hypothetical protein
MVQVNVLCAQPEFPSNLARFFVRRIIPFRYKNQKERFPARGVRSQSLTVLLQTVVL